jgi:hypothetical protein
VNPDQWQRVQELFHIALEQDPAKREAFLDQACGDDRALRQEVSSLIAAHQKGGSFLETREYESDSQKKARAAALHAPGQSVGPYRIVRQIGRGGMGVVYLAEDTRLGRQVALKALSPEWLGDKEREQRLRLEARAAAALSHPSIATVYALEEFEGRLYIASEFVRGRTLRAELAQGGPLPFGTLLEVGLDIAQGLAAAHTQGIVHRDLKPENILRSESGGIKILDFGLARMIAPEAVSGERLTASGMILGTPAYMSPEQLQGRELDFRCDIFTFGVLLYELACGAHPFEGQTPLSTAARILEADPPPLPDQIAGSSQLDQIIRRCVRKKPAERYGSTAELIRELEALRSGAAKLSSAAVAGGRPALGQSDTGPHTRWWEVHQIGVLALYALMALSAWKVKEWKPNALSLLLFFAVVVCAAINGTLRSHLLFIARFSRPAMTRQMRRVQPWIRRCDWIFTLLVLAIALNIAGQRHVIAALLAAVAIGYLIVFLVIEPPTTTAAFSKRGGKRAKSSSA